MSDEQKNDMAKTSDPDEDGLRKSKRIKIDDEPMNDLDMGSVESLSIAIRRAVTYDELRDIILANPLPDMSSPPSQATMKLECLFLQENALSTPVIPDDIPQKSEELVAADIYGDGNCNSRCLSVLGHGCQTFYKEMRVRVIAELVKNVDDYTDERFMARGHTFDPYILSTLRAYSCSGLVDPVLHLQEDIMMMHRAGDDMDVYAVAATVCVLNHPIVSVFPRYGGYTVLPDLHRVFMPRSMKPYYPGIIMWMRSDGCALEPKEWRANHFVLLLPVLPHVDYHYFSIRVLLKRNWIIYVAKSTMLSTSL